MIAKIKVTPTGSRYRITEYDGEGRIKFLPWYAESKSRFLGQHPTTRWDQTTDLTTGEIYLTFKGA